MNDPQENDSFNRAFVHGELHLGFWSFVKKGTGALNSFFVLSSLSLYQFGSYQLLLSLYGILSDIFQDLFGEVMVNDLARFIGEGREDKAKRLFFEYASFRTVMAVIPCAGLFFAAPFLSFRYGSDTVNTIRILSFLFLADAGVALATLVLNLRLQFKILAPRATFQKLLQFLALGSFYVFSHLGVREIFLSQIIGTAGTVLILLPVVIVNFAPWRRVKAFSSPLIFRIIRSYGKWEIPDILLNDFTGKVRPWLIKLFLSTEAVGIFSVANTFISALKDLIPTRTAGVLVPRRAKDPAALERFYRLGTKYYVWFGAALALAAAGGVPVVVHMLFPKFTSALPVFYVMLVVVPMFAFVKPMSFFLVAFRRRRFIFLQSAFQNAVWLGLALILLPTAGLLGLGLVEVVASGTNIVARYEYLKRAGLISRFSPRALITFDSEDRMHGALLMRYLRSFLNRG